MFVAILIVVIVVIGLSLLIFGHEAGHFFAAKAFGLRVDEFGFGFPPRIFAWKRGDTEYSVNWLPFGGFVRIAGERGEFEMVRPETTTTVGERSADPAESAAPAAQPTDTSRLLYAQPAWKKSLIMLAGVFVNFLLGWLFLSLTLMIGAPKALVITGVQSGSPAATVGFMSGDVVQGYKDAQSFVNYVDAHRGQPITVSVDRNGKTVDETVTPRVNPPQGQGAIGVELADAGAQGEGFFPAMRDGLVNAGVISWLVLLALWHLVAQLFTHASLLPGVVGPVGIFGVAEQTGRVGLVYLLQLIGVISVNLMVVNLIPFPALDGGRFVMAIVEKIKGSPIPYKVESWINGIGFAFIIGLLILLTIRDVGGLI